jgi:myo-inositol-1(or 4)-monophosphatase
VSPAELARRLPIAASLAREAAALAARLREEGAGAASMKGAQDFVTVADGETEAFLRTRLGALFPGEPVLGEEQGGAIAADGPLWVLDPIDGTSNYTRGGDRWCVSVGLAWSSRAVLGAIARHAPDEIVAGAAGCGATLNGRGIRAAETREMARATVELGWSLRTPLDAFLALSARVMHAGAGLRCGGSGALGLADVAIGRCDAYLELHINAWDACAALAIAREAGCWSNAFDSGEWLARGNPVGIAAPGLAAAATSWLEA